MAGDSVQNLTAELYLEVERAAEFRGEYHDGARFPKEGGTRNHGRIAGAVLAELYVQRGNRDFDITAHDLRLAIPRYDAFVYPDVLVSCGSDHYLDDCGDTLTDATLVVEVLSPSSKDYDRREKFRFYRSLPSLKEYLVLAQDEVRAEYWFKEPDGAWGLREFLSLSDEIKLTSIGCRLRLDAVYARVEFEPR